MTGTCQCDEHEYGCTAAITQEDLLCDACRPRTCVFVTINDEPVEHASQETVVANLRKMGLL